MHYMDRLAPVPRATNAQLRTISAWGEACQADLARLRVGVVGVGSVGGFIAEALVRMGIEDVLLMDFDFIEEHNLDRLVYATKRDIGRLKVQCLATYLKGRATARRCRIEQVHEPVYQEMGFRKALDCDVLF